MKIISCEYAVNIVAAVFILLAAVIRREYRICEGIFQQAYKKHDSLWLCP